SSGSRRFFLATLTRPPTPALFPYTTLFRSATVEGGGESRPRDLLRGHRRQRCLVARGGPREGDQGEGEPDPRRADGAGAARPEPDRKSTRLNSSHVAISYAVFCSKKKRRRR